ncbi:MAG: hypothetical protein JO290_01900 [Sphingomonadaceae bacterium]|nr:hypothetical protein [Sphingomonadaceae bacterium]
MTLLLSLAVLAALALIGVGLRALATGRGDRVRAGLMVAAGVIVLINVVLITAPVPAP